MLEIKTNIGDVVGRLQNGLGALLNTDPLLRIIASSMTAVVRTRVHENGLAANGSPIGSYHPEYLKRRQESPYNRTGDPKIILSLTRQMENDMKPIPTQQGWGIGYSNPFNYDKAIWNEQRENQKILTALTTEEDKQVGVIVEEYIDAAIKTL